MKVRNSRRRRRLKCPVLTWPLATSRGQTGWWCRDVCTRDCTHAATSHWANEAILGLVPELESPVSHRHRSDRIFRRIQVQPHNVGRFLGKFRVGAQAPTAAPLQMDPMPSQNPPDLMFTHISESLGHQPSCPSGKARGRSLIQHRQDASFRLLVIALRRSLPRPILEAFSPMLGKAGAPLADAGLSRSQAKATSRFVCPSASARIMRARSASR